MKRSQKSTTATKAMVMQKSACTHAALRTQKPASVQENQTMIGKCRTTNISQYGKQSHMQRIVGARYLGAHAAQGDGTNGEIIKFKHVDYLNDIYVHLHDETYDLRY